MIFFYSNYEPGRAELIKHIPAFKKESIIYGHKRLKLSKSNAFHLKSPPFPGPMVSNAIYLTYNSGLSGAQGLPMKENIKISGEQLPEMAGAEKRILKKALRAG